MELDKRMQNVTVIGAAGKMGSGISLLIASEMARLKLLPENKAVSYRLYMVDVNEDAFDGLWRYIKTQAVKRAEKSIVMLRKLYEDREDLIENEEIINAFADEIMSVIRMGTDINAAKDSRLVFEAIVENRKIKAEVFGKLKKICPADTFFMTNTSSIPIHILDEDSSLGGRIIGYHFYNPPVVQKLIELISSEGTIEELKQVSFDLAKRLGKKIIPANDIAGFIGNGHFIRDGLHAISEAGRCSEKSDMVEGIYIMNRVSQEFMVRPMGIFQLIDYVGVDVFQCIMKVMNEFIIGAKRKLYSTTPVKAWESIKGEDIHSSLIEQMADKKILGGQRADGSQKDGFLQYKKDRPAGVYDIKTGSYRAIDPEGWTGEIDKKIGPLPAGYFPWKALASDPKKEDKLSQYFKNLLDTDSLGAKLAKAYLLRSKEIGLKLVEDKVANSTEDVNGVLTSGFFHLYGPVNNYIASVYK